MEETLKRKPGRPKGSGKHSSKERKDEIAITLDRTHALALWHLLNNSWYCTFAQYIRNEDLREGQGGEMDVCGWDVWRKLCRFLDKW